MSEPGGWRRLYPLSPIVRGGRGTIGIVILLVPALLRGGISAGDLVPLGVIALITLLGFVSWFVTRWTIDGDDLRIETGVLRRRSLRFPLSQVQAIDIMSLPLQPNGTSMGRLPMLKLTCALEKQTSTLRTKKERPL